MRRYSIPLTSKVIGEMCYHRARAEMDNSNVDIILSGTSRDCPIFYRRKKTAKDLMDAEATLKKFDW